MTTPAPWLPQGRWLPTPAFTLVGLVLVLALSSALAVESAQVPDDKRSATGLDRKSVV